MRISYTISRFMFTALLLAIIFIPSTAQNYEEQISPQLPAASSFSEGMARVILFGKTGFVNTNGKQVISCKYDIADDFKNGFANVILHGKYGKIDKKDNFTFLHNVTIGDINWLCGDFWVIYRNSESIPDLTIYSNGNVQELTDYFSQYRETKNASILYDKDVDKYYLVCSKEGESITRYQIDFINKGLIRIDGVQLRHMESVVQVPEPLPTPFSSDKEEPSPEPKATTAEVFHTSATLPSFPGGNEALGRYFSMNMVYPQAAIDNNIQGKVVVSFVVEKDGSIGEVKIVQSVNEDIDREAVRLIKNMPKFIPGRNADGEPVRVWYTMPLYFRLVASDE